MKAKESIIKIKRIFFRNEKIFFSLEDGQKISFPLKWYPKLYLASEEELLDYSISHGGYGRLWDKVDEDLSVYGMLNYNLNLNTISQ